MSKTTTKRARTDAVPSLCWTLVFGFLPVPELFLSCRLVCHAWSEAKASWSHLSVHDERLIAACLPASLRSLEVDEHEGGPPLSRSKFRNVRTLCLHLGLEAGARDMGEQAWTELPNLETVHVRAGGDRKLYHREFLVHHQIKSCRFDGVTPCTDTLFQGRCLETLELVDVNLFRCPELLGQVVSCPTLVNLSLRDCVYTTWALSQFMEQSIAQKRKWVSLDVVSRFVVIHPMGGDMASSQFAELFKSDLFRRFAQDLETFKFNFRPSPAVLDALPNLKNLEMEDLPRLENRLLTHLPPKLERLLLSPAVGHYGYGWDTAELDELFLLRGHGTLKELVLKNIGTFSSTSIGNLCLDLPALERLVLLGVWKEKFRLVKEMLNAARPNIQVTGIALTII